MEDQIVSGDGTGENFTGLLNVSGTQTLAAPTAPASNLDNIRKAITLVRTNARSEPSAIVLNPTGAQNIDLLKQNNEANNFVGPGPYGVGAARLWNVPVVETDALSAGTALIGDFSKASRRRGPGRGESSCDPLLSARGSTLLGGEGRQPMADVPQWHLRGDWFDVCKCNIPCPCYFAQTPTFGDCDGSLVWHIRDGRYGDVVLDGLNVLALAAFTGNIWDGETKAAMGVFFDERADEGQREALQAIFGGEAGGWPGGFAEFIGEMRGIEFAPIEFEIDDDLGSWSARIPGRVEARAEALTGPTTRPGERVQVHNPPGSEVGPGTVATQGVAVADQAEGFEFRWERTGQSSKHMAFDWSGPDQP